MQTVKAKQKSEAILLQPRDFSLLRGFFESRVMSTEHAAALFFNGSREAAKKRLQKLKAAGYVTERTRKAYEPSILYLTRKSFELLRENGILDEYPPLSLAALEKRARVSDLTIRHELEVMDVKAAFHSALRNSDNFQVKEFTTWPLLHEFEVTRAGHITDVLVKPDGFIRIHEREVDGALFEHSFFLEVDRSSETQDTLVARAGCYIDFYKSGGFAIRNGGTRADFKEFPFRVLMVFKSAERRNNTAERLLRYNPPILTQVCLSTLEDAVENPLGNIWIRPLEYREAISGTPFDANSRTKQQEYKRQTEREFCVEALVQRTIILD